MNEEVFDDFKPTEDATSFVSDTSFSFFEKDQSEVEEFKEDRIDMIIGMADDPKDALTSLVISYVQGVGDVNQVNLCSYNNHNGVALDGWSFNGDEDQTTIDLFLTVYVDPEDSLKLSPKDIDKHFNWLQRFFDKSGSILNNITDKKSDLYQVAYLISQTEHIDRIRLFLLTNAIIPSSYSKDDIDLEDNMTCEFHIWDARRIMRQDKILSGREAIKVDFDGDYNCTLPCIKMPDVSENVTCYLCIISGIVLSQVYHKYHQQILEMNVRTFLQFKGASNKGIRNTLIGHTATAREKAKGIVDCDPEPDMFFSYNNGISATASGVELNSEGNAIVSIRDWQIVNGGQTTAAISAVMSMKDIDYSQLAKVFVPMKISVIKQKDMLTTIVPKISRFANTQSAVKKSDFGINEDFLVELERMSREEWFKNPQGKPIAKWFFERSRGQYLDKAKRQPNAAAETDFYSEYPQNKMFDKTELSKYVMSWEQNPASVCKGGENNYTVFVERMRKQSTHFDKKRYHRTIGQAILFRAIDALYGKNGINLPGYKSNMVAYTMSVLSLLSKKTLDLETLWNEQCVISQSTYNKMTIDLMNVYAQIVCGAAHVTYKVKTSYVDSNGKRKNRFEPHDFSDDDLNMLRTTKLYHILLFVRKIEPVIYSHLITEVKAGENINEWTKKPVCWEELKLKFNNDADKYPIPAGLCASFSETETEITESQQKFVDTAMEVSAEEWFDLNKWAKEDESRLTPKETAFVGQLGFLVKRGRAMTYKQAKWALDILEKAEGNGWKH